MENAVSVSQVNRYIKLLMDCDTFLEDIWIKGEISNFKHHYTGHMYFTLKDEESLIKCVMFKGQNANIKFMPQNGMKVVIRARVSVFERDGQYQCYVKEIIEYGVGNLHVEFERLKKKLSEKGYFEKEGKKKIPYMPKNIVVLTSKTGAVIRDILNVLGRRYPNFRLKLLPIPVQGKNAAPLIARAITLANEKKLGDVIILARGGGSLEELWAFNEEVVADSIFSSQIPIISAIGHETDFTISDFVADLRAPTPSAAAELVMPEKMQVKNNIDVLNVRMRNAILNRINAQKDKLNNIKNRKVLKGPFDIIYQYRLQLDVLNKYLEKNEKEYLKKKRIDLKTLIGKVNALSPLAVLARGYSILKEEDTNKIVTSVNSVRQNSKVVVTLKDGELMCDVRKIVVKGGKG